MKIEEIQKAAGLESSIPANNQKIIEIYNKLRTGLLTVNRAYQRKLVWKKPHKYNFIETILKNYPFPEVYLAQAELDQQTLTYFDEIVDGQQRLTTIQEYIEGTDVFSLQKMPIKKFSELSPEERLLFLNYEVSVRYLKNANQEQVKEIFQRINKTDYRLNAAERLNAQWGDSEFVCFAKQMVEPEFDNTNVLYVMEKYEREAFLKFFHGTDDGEELGVFTENDISRMLALQYALIIIATLVEGEYFSRNDKVKFYIEEYNENFPEAENLKCTLLESIDFINKLSLENNSLWFSKTNLFTILIELSKIDLSVINIDWLSTEMANFEVKATEQQDSLTRHEIKFLEYGREAVNEKVAREFRATFFHELLFSSQQR